MRRRPHKRSRSRRAPQLAESLIRGSLSLSLSLSLARARTSHARAHFEPCARLENRAFPNRPRRVANSDFGECSGLARDQHECAKPIAGPHRDVCSPMLEIQRNSPRSRRRRRRGSTSRVAPARSRILVKIYLCGEYIFVRKRYCRVSCVRRVTRDARIPPQRERERGFRIKTLGGTTRTRVVHACRDFARARLYEQESRTRRWGYRRNAAAAARPNRCNAASNEQYSHFV